ARSRAAARESARWSDSRQARKPTADRASKTRTAVVTMVARMIPGEFVHGSFHGCPETVIHGCPELRGVPNCDAFPESRVNLVLATWVSRVSLRTSNWSSIHGCLELTELMRSRIGASNERRRSKLPEIARDRQEPEPRPLV